MAVHIYCSSCYTSNGLGAEKCSNCGASFGRGKRYRVSIQVNGKRATRVVDMLNVARRVEAALKADLEKDRTDIADPRAQSISSNSGQAPNEEDFRRRSETGKDSLAKDLQLEDLISQLSGQFINLPYDQIDGEIEKGQKMVCQLLDLHRSYFGEFASDMKSIHMTHSWMAPGIECDIPDIITDDGAFPYFSYIVGEMQKGELVIYSDPEDLPAGYTREKNAAFFLSSSTSAVIVPLKVGNNILGAISWGSCGVRRHWIKQLLERLVTISQVFGNAVSRKKTEQALRESITEISKLKDQLQAENRYLIEEIKLEHQHHKIVGKSSAIREILSVVEQVAQTCSTVLLLGETGTGKELIAQQIHSLSPRKDRPMVSINCSALSPTLIESEMFGHERGAYSGAFSRRSGRFELANNSTIFLDEIGDLPLELQPKLLRVLEDGTFQRLGGSETTTVDVRVVAATNKDLAAAVLEGKFRPDLFYRLNIFPIVLPPLRDRAEDIPLLVKAFVETFSKTMGKHIDSIPQKSLDALQRYYWPGNIRELRNLVERAMIVTKDSALEIQLPETGRRQTSRIGRVKESTPGTTGVLLFEGKEPATTTMGTMDQVQRTCILTALKKTGFRVSGDEGAAKLLGMNPSTLRYRMRQLGISRKQLFR